MMRFLLLFLVMSVSVNAKEEVYTINFGVVMKNDAGEPVGFKETTTIPVGKAQQKTLYGVVVSRNDETPFLLGTVHIIPTLDDNVTTKVMGKPMQSTNRGAVFLQSDEYDIAGDYAMEIYLDNQLLTTVHYQLKETVDLTSNANAVESDNNMEIASQD